MRFWRSRSKLATVLAIAILATGGWLIFKPDNKNPTLATKGANLAKQVSIETADFKYSKPVGWIELSPKVLDSTGAASGIGRPSEPVATFSVKVLDTTPKDNNDLKKSTLNGLSEFTNFQLVSDVDTKVDGQAGQKFTYNFSNTSGNNKTAQQMSVVPYKQKTFYLLFSSAAADYDKQTGDFTNILASFHFK